jgi:hypothetical protein
MKTANLRHRGQAPGFTANAQQATSGTKITAAMFFCLQIAIVQIKHRQNGWNVLSKLHSWLRQLLSSRGISDGR